MKKKKVTVCVLIGILVLWTCFFATDYALAKSNKSPVFSVPIIRYKDGGSTEYYGLGYKVIKYVNLTIENGLKVTNVDIGSWFMKFSK